jgi:hypothetical protein
MNRKTISFFLTIIFIVSMIPIVMTNAALVEDKDDIIKNGLNYYVIDVYANGTEFIRGMKNTNTNTPLGIKQATQYTHPLSSDRFALSGGDELAFNLWRDWDGHIGGTPDTHLGFIDGKTHDDTNFNQTMGNAFFHTKVEDSDASLVNYLPMKTTMGDVDGSFRENLIGYFTSTVETFDGDPYEAGVDIRIYERWLDGTLQLVASNKNFPFGGWQTSGNSDAQFPDLATAQLDNDAAKEIIVVGVENGQQTVWIFDDLMQSIEPGLFRYNQSIAIQAPTGFRHFQAVGDDVQAHPINGLLQAPTSFVFRPINPHDLTSTSTIDEKSEFVLLHSSGKYVHVNNVTGDVTLVTVDNDEFTEAHIFSLTASTGDVSVQGDFYLNQFGSFLSQTGGIVDFQGSNVGASADIPGKSHNTFKIVNASALPFNFATDNPPYLKKFTIPGFVHRQVSISGFEDQYFGSLNIAAGDIDGDGRDEFVVVGLNSTKHAHAWVFDDALNDFELLKTFTWPYQNRNPAVAIGDLDGDGKAEIVFSWNSHTQSSSVYIYDDATNNFELIKKLLDNDEDFKTRHSRLLIDDLTGDGNNELFFVTDYSHILMYSGSHNNYELITDLEVGGIDGADHPSLAIGDLDSDSVNELYVGYTLDNSGAALAMYTYEDSEFKLAHYYEYKGAGQHPKVNIAIADFSGDKFYLEFLDEIGQFQTPGEVQVAAAAPPNQLGISQNYDFTGTSFGTGTSTSTTDGVGVTSGYGYFLQAEAGFDIGFLSIGGGAQRTITEEFTTTNTITKTITYFDEFGGGNLDNFVVYSATVYDTYYYKILESQDPRLVGRTITINVPREPEVYLQTIEYYNSIKNPGDYTIGTSIFPHTAGHVPSYPSKDFYTNKESVLFSNQRVVGQGGGSQTVSIDVATETEETFEYTKTTEWEAGGSVTVFGIGGGGGGVWTDSETAIHSVGVGKNTAFSGEVGSIQNTREYTDFEYSFGLVVYLETITRFGLTFSFYVINYWVVLPPNWGGGSITQASEVKQVAGGINELVVQIPVQILSIISSLFIVSVLLTVNKRRKLI